MIRREIVVEDATPQSLEPFGRLVATDNRLPFFAEWAGVQVYGSFPIEIGAGGEVLHARMAASRFPAPVTLLERHFNHTQTYLSANGRPFVMVFGAETQRGLPVVGALRAFLFKDGAGIIMHSGVWHEFPVALEDDTRFTVVLNAESHINDLAQPAHPLDARGPDLERYDMRARADIILRLAGPSEAN